AAAQNNLGLLLRDGRGVGRDAAQAIEWFKKAAAQKYTKAMLNLGSLLEQMAKDAATPAAAVPVPPASPATAGPVSTPLAVPAVPVGTPLPASR
ncbi:MAG: tetratricopeptide repeat protein, partial [Burkholderiaceae bacterium]